jgi:excisionase family DNA binding protein
MPTNRMAPQDEADLLRQASSPLEAEESNIAEAQIIRAEVQLERRDAYNTRVIQADAAQVISGKPGMPEAEQALIESAIETVTERPPAHPAHHTAAIEQPMLFDTENLARREEEKRRSRGPSPKQKREDLIEELLDPVVSLEEAATILNVCKTTVRRYTNQGLLECIRTPGNQRRFKLSTILNFVDVKDVKGIGKRGRKPKKRDDATA